MFWQLASLLLFLLSFFFFFNDTATTEIYTLSLHDALPICRLHQLARIEDTHPVAHLGDDGRSEEHTSELQSQFHLVCRLLLEKKNKNNIHVTNSTQNKQQTLKHNIINYT